MSDSLNTKTDSNQTETRNCIIPTLFKMQIHTRNLINKINYREPSSPHGKRLGNIPQNKQI
jgi:hypothetical protein